MLILSYPRSEDPRFIIKTDGWKVTEVKPEEFGFKIAHGRKPEEMPRYVLVLPEKKPMPSKVRIRQLLKKTLNKFSFSHE